MKTLPDLHMSEHYALDHVTSYLPIKYGLLCFNLPEVDDAN